MTKEGHEELDRVYEGSKEIERSIEYCIKELGGDDAEDTPVPIPNTEVKLCSADDTWLVTARESRKLPG